MRKDEVTRKLLELATVKYREIFASKPKPKRYAYQDWYSVRMVEHKLACFLEAVKAVGHVA